MGKILEFRSSGAAAAADLLSPLEGLQKEILGEKVSAYAAIVITEEGPRFWYSTHPEASMDDVMLLLAATNILERDLNDAIRSNLPDSDDN